MVFKQKAVSRAAALVAASLSLGASAFTLDTGVEGLKATWDNTLKYSAAYRLKDRNPALTADPNLDDGDQNFSKGIVSNRLDLLSEFDLEYKDNGFRISGAGWYDQVYNESNDNPGPPGAYPNNLAAYNRFPSQTRSLHGRKAELLDAFVFSRFSVGDMPALVRLGRHGQVWGETFFFGANGIAGGMAPVDIVKLISVPGTQFKEAIRPVSQISGQLQLTPTVTLGAYYQFRWERNRFPGVGSYFSAGDTGDVGGNVTLNPVVPFLAPPTPRSGDVTPKNSGQGGVQLRFSAYNTDFGLYAIRFHNRTFQLVPTLDLSNPAIPVETTYKYAFQEGVISYGASASRTFGSVNVATEVSVRRHMDLASTGFDISTLPASDNRGNPGYAVGNTAHANISAIWQIDPNPLFKEGLFVAEVMWNRALSCRTACDKIDPNSTRDAYGLQTSFEPTYRQVVNGLDIGVPMTLGYTPRGSRSRALGPGSSENGGVFSIGLNGSYLDAWRMTLTYTRFYGAAKPFLTPIVPHYTYGQSYQDRDFIALSVRRTF